MTIKQPLTQNDLEAFARSFVAQETAEQAGLFRVNDIDGAELLGRKPKAGTDYSGVVFPYFLPEQLVPREYRIRRDHPDKVEQPDGSVKEEGKYLTSPGCRNMLYFPPGCSMEHLKDVSLPIIVTEGFKQPLALHRASWYGLQDAATNPRFLVIGLSGVWNFRGTKGKAPNPDGTSQKVKGFINDFDLLELKGRKITILYDDSKEKEGVYFAEQSFAKELTVRGAKVFIADCPSMEGCNGIDDVLGKIEREQNTDAAIKKCFEVIEKAKPFKTDKVSQANQILHLAEDVDFFHTSDGEAFASIEVNGHIENHRVRSKNFREWLAYQYYQTDGKPPSNQALQDAINSLCGKAVFEGKTKDTFIRLAYFQEKIYLDLCNDDWQILEIDSEGWRIIEASDAPVCFKRTKAMMSLPTPTNSGDITKLQGFLNVDRKNLVLILAWLINCFRPNYPFPILILSGEQGTAKSTTSKILRELVDPSLAPFRSAPRDERDLIIAAINAWVCAFDNLSIIPNWLSDGFCRLATGGTVATRTLYSDDEETIFTAKRPIILNGIGDIASRSDLLDRALLVKLEVIPRDKRKTEREFWTEFDHERTSIFSGLVSAISLALKNIESTFLTELPRMADFALWATASEKGLGLKENEFIKAYTQNREDAHSIVLEDSILAEVLQEYCEKWKETSGDFLLKDFLNELKEVAGEKRSSDKLFPKSPKGLRNAIERINPNLRETGIFITFHGRSGGNASKGASLTLEYSPKQTSLTSQTSQSLQNQAQTSDVSENGNITKNSNVTNGGSNVTNTKLNGHNGLEIKDDVSDVSDVTFHSYSKVIDEREVLEI